MNLRLPDKIEPLLWDVLKTYHKNPPNTPFPRTNNVYQAYKKHKEGLDLIKKDISVFVKEQYFSGIDASKVSCLTENKFPYLLGPGIQHKVLWFNPRVTMSKQFPSNLNQSSGFIDICLTKKMENILNDYDVIYFENQGQCRSVPGIRHIQVFLRPKDFKEDDSNITTNTNDVEI